MSLSLLPTNSLWFERFALGCLKRMGRDVWQDWAITLTAMHNLLDVLEEEWEAADSWELRHRVATAGAFAVIAFCGSFRGNEVFLMDLFGLARYAAELEAEEHVIVPLLGMYKGEAHHCYHLTPLAAVTSSGIQVRTWICRLVQVQREAGRSHGPAFGDRHGDTLGSGFVEGLLADRLQLIKDTRPGIIPKEVDCNDHFGISRSFRRGATTTAHLRGVEKRVVDLTNRWRKFEDAKGRRPELIKFSKAF